MQCIKLVTIVLCAQTAFDVLTLGSGHNFKQLGYVIPSAPMKISYNFLDGYNSGQNYE